MTPFDIGLYSLVAIVILVYMGFWVPFALMLSSYIGVWLIKDSSILAGKLLALAASETISSYFFGVVPLFVFMGNIVSERAFPQVLKIITRCIEMSCASVLGLSINDFKI